MVCWVAQEVKIEYLDYLIGHFTVLWKFDYHDRHNFCCHSVFNLALILEGLLYLIHCEIMKYSSVAFPVWD